MRRHGFLYGNGLMVINLGESFQDIVALLWKMLDQLDEVSPTVDEAVGQDGLELFGEIATEGIAHLDRWIEAVLPGGQDLGDIFAGMPAPGKKQGDRSLLLPGDDTGSKNPRSFRVIRHLVFRDQLENLH